MVYKVGDEVGYRVIDEEHRSRGYGIIYETGKSKIRSLHYRLLNGMTISEREIVERMEDMISYRTPDMEYYSRGYGINYETGTSKLVSILYTLENGYQITEFNILSE